MSLSLRIREDKVYVTSRKNTIFSLAYRVYDGKMLKRPLGLKVEGSDIEVKFDGCTICDHVTEIENKIIVSRKWEIDQTGDWALYFDFETILHDADVMIPAILYNKNKSGSGSFPKGGLEVGWSFREDRLPIPSCSVIYNDKNSFILYTDPASSEKYISSILSKKERNNVFLSIRIPAEEKPLIFNGKKSVEKSEDTTLDYLILKESDIPFSYERTFYLKSDTEKGTNLPLKSYRDLVENLETEVADSTDKSSLDWTEFVTLKLKNLLFLLEENNSSGSYFIMGRGNGDHQYVYELTGGSFLVRSLDGAFLLAKTGMLTGKDDLIHKAVEVGKFFLQGKRNNGLHYDNYDLVTGEWGGYLGVSENTDYKFLYNTRANGETMTGYIQLYLQLREAGIDMPEFLNVAVENAEFYLIHQLPNGSFGRWWNDEGELIDGDGTNGAHIVSFLLELEPYYSKPEKIAPAVERAADYYSGLIKNDEYFGDTLDADACDRESGLVLLQMFLNLYKNKRNPEYLEYAKRAADFVLTWVWQYNVVFPPDTPLFKHSFRTSGMTSVSVAHHHLDFYGLQIGYEFLRLWKYTKSDIYKLMGLKMINACNQLIAVKDDYLGRGPEYEGWQPEQMNHTKWEYFGRIGRQKGYFDICISWVTVLELTSLFKLKEEFPEIIDFEVKV